MFKRIKFCFTSALLLGALATQAGEHLTGIACRSVHMQYPEVRNADEIQITVTPRESHPGTYFASLGFNMGYFGIQELYNSKKVVIFSVWEPGAAQDPNKVPEEQQVEVLYHDEAVRTGRFGWEGTGAQSFYDFDWKIDHAYKFRVTAVSEGEKTAFTGWFFNPDLDEWKKLATFRTQTGGHLLGGVYSFVEDFRRNKVSATKRRAAEFGQLKFTTKGEEKVATLGMFTADGNKSTNINSSVKGEFFLLETGGEVKNSDIQLWKRAHVAAPQTTEPAAAKTK